MNRKGQLVPLPALPALSGRMSLVGPPIPGIKRKEKKIGESEKSQECVQDAPRKRRFSSIQPLASPQTPKMNPSDNINFGKKEKKKEKNINGELEKEAKRNMMQGIEECSVLCTEEVEVEIEKDIFLQPETTEALQLMDKVQQQPSVSSRGNYSCAPFNEQKVERPPTYDELKQIVNQYTSDLEVERARNGKLLSALEDAFNQQQDGAEDFKFATETIQEMALELSCLQNELEASENKRQLCEKQLQEDAEALEKEKARYSRAYKEIQMQMEESAVLKASFKAMETENERLKSKHHTFSESREEMMSKKNDSRLEEAIKKERAEKELMQAQVADLRKSQKELQQTKERLKVTITDTTAELEEHKKVIEKLQRDLEASSSLPKEAAECDRVNRAEIKALRVLIGELQEKSQQKDDEIESMLVNIQNLKSSIEAKESNFSSLQQTVDQYASDLRDEKTRNGELLSALKNADSQQQKKAEDFEFATQANQQMAFEISCLQNELEASETERQLCEKQLQEDAEALEKEKARYSRAYEEIQTQKEESAVLKASFKAMETENERLKSKHRAFSESYEEMVAKKNNSILEEAIKKERAEKEFVHTQVADLQKSQKELRQTKESLKVTITEMTAKLEEHKKVIEKLQRDLEASSSNFSSLQQTVDQSVSDLRDERARNCDLQRDYEDAVSQQQKEAEIRSRLEEAIKKEKDRFLRAYYKIKMQKEENADIRDKLKTTETEYERMKSEHRLLSERHEEMAKKPETNSDRQSTVDKLVNMVDELRAQQSESKTRQGKLKQKLKQEMTKNVELQQRVDQMSSALVKEKTMCEKHRVELKEALTKQIETLEEKHKFSQALERAQHSLSLIQAQHMAKSDFQFGHISDTDFRLHQQWQSDINNEYHKLP